MGTLSRANAPKLKRSESMKTAHLLFLAFSTAAAIAEPTVLAAESPRGELLVKWRDGPQSASATVGNTKVGSTVKRNFNAIGWQLVELPPGVSERDAIEAYRALGTVLAV